jgi:hypothetical protein
MQGGTVSMAKVFILLLGILVVVNVMTFLVVVQQGTPATTAEPAGTAASSARSPATPDLQAQRLERIERQIDGLKNSIRDLSVKLDKLSLSSSRMASSGGAASVRATPSSPSPASRVSGPPGRRTGPVDFSRPSQPPATPPAAAGATEEPEGEEKDPVAPAQPVAQPSTEPAAGTGDSGAGTEGSEKAPGDSGDSTGSNASGAGQAQPATPAEGEANTPPKESPEEKPVAEETPQE